MKVKEKFKEQIYEIASGGHKVTFNLSGDITRCDIIACNQCIAKDSVSCPEAIASYMNKELGEPCSFKEGELIEVRDYPSDNEWSRRRFAYKANGSYYCFPTKYYKFNQCSDDEIEVFNSARGIITDVLFDDVTECYCSCNNWDIDVEELQKLMLQGKIKIVESHYTKYDLRYEEKAVSK